MARKGSNEEVANTEAVATDESAVTTDPTQPEVETVDISAFVSVADGALQSEDFAAVTTAYNELDRKGKGAATRHVNAAIRQSLQDKQPEQAMAWSGILGALTPVKAAKERKAREPKVAADTTESTVSRMASLYLAYRAVSDNLPEDKADEIKASVKELVDGSADELAGLIAWRTSTDEAKGDAPEASDVVSRAVKLAFSGSGKKSSGGGSTSTYDGPRRSIGQHIAEAFEGKDSGTFLSVAEIRNFESTVYGTDHPSAGAISSALNSGKSLPEGISKATGGPKGNAGAVKA